MTCTNRASARQRSASGWKSAAGLSALASVALVTPGLASRPAVVLSASLDASARSALGELESGELRITWREDGPEVAIADLRSRTRGEVTYDKGSAAPAFDTCYLAAPFDYTTKNRLGGDIDTGGRMRTDLVATAPGRALRATYQSGPVAPELDLIVFDGSPIDDRVYYLDARAFGRVDLRLRATSPVRVDVVLIDADGRVSAPVTLDVETTWERFRVTTDVDDIHRHHLARVQLRPHGDGVLEIDEFHLCQRGHRPAKSTVGTTAGPDSVWVWHTSDLMADGPTAVADLVDLMQQVDLGRVYLQVPGGLDEATTQAALGAVVEQIAGADLEVFALAGSPTYASPGGTRDLMQVLDRLLDYNDTVAAAARFRGLHLDVEPYLLPGWSTARQEVVRDFLGMLDAVQAASAPAGLALEAAVPFWFDSVPVHREHGDRTRSRSLTDAVLDHVDSIAVMDYRTRIDGSNGVLALAEMELAAALTRDRKVWIGLETTSLPDVTLVRFRGSGRAGLPSDDSSDWWVVEAGDEILVANAAGLEELKSRLGELAAESLTHWPARGVEVPASRQTFHDLGFESLREVMRAARTALGGHPAFGGLALHYDRPLRRLARSDS